MNKVIATIHCVLFSLLAGATGFASTTYVSTTGTDEFLCGTIGKPCLTIQHAVEASALSGDLVIAIAEGAYDESITLPDPAGSLDLTLTFQCGWNNDFTQRSTSPGATVLQPADPTKWVFWGSISAWENLTVIIDSCTIQNANKALAFTNSQGNLDAIVKNSILKNNQTGIYLTVSGTGNSNLQVSDNSEIKHHTLGAFAASASGASAQLAVNIENSVFQFSNECGIAVGTMNGASATFLSKNNIITDNGSESSDTGGLCLNSSGSGSTLDADSTNDTIVNNTNSSYPASGLKVKANDTAEINVKLVNDIIWNNYGSGGRGDIAIINYDSTIKVTASYSDIGTVYDSAGDSYTSNSGNISTDPLLNSNYRLSKNSPAVDSAQCGYYSLFIPGKYYRVAPYDDIDGQSRPEDGALVECDMGAGEYHDTLLCFPVKAKNQKTGIICF